MGLCSKGIAMKLQNSSDDFTRQVSPLFLFFLQQHWSAHTDPCTSNAGFFSHADHCDREGGSLPAAPREGSAAERKRGPEEKSGQSPCDKLKSGPSPEGNCAEPWAAVLCMFALITTCVLYQDSKPQGYLGRKDGKTWPSIWLCGEFLWSQLCRIFHSEENSVRFLLPDGAGWR